MVRPLRSLRPPGRLFQGFIVETCKKDKDKNQDQYFAIIYRNAYIGHYDIRFSQWQLILNSQTP